MKSLKTFVIGLLAGLIVGLWLGVNIGRDRPLYSNPFAERGLQEKLMKSSGDMLEKSGKALKEKLQEQQ